MPRESATEPKAARTPKVRVFCVEDHTLVLEGLQLIIQRQPDLEVVGVARNGQEAVRLHRRYRPDVTLMDLQLPVMDGFEAIRGIRANNPSARIIVLTTYQGDQDIFRALEAGAAAYVLKDALSKDLIGIIRQVHAGMKLIPPDAQGSSGTHPMRPALSRRETEVVRLIARGLRDKEVASVPGISAETVQGYVKSIFTKLGVHDRTAAAQVALRRGIIHLED